MIQQISQPEGTNHSSEYQCIARGKHSLRAYYDRECELTIIWKGPAFTMRVHRIKSISRRPRRRPQNARRCGIDGAVLVLAGGVVHFGFGDERGGIVEEHDLVSENWNLGLKEGKLLSRN